MHWFVNRYICWMMRSYSIRQVWLRSQVNKFDLGILFVNLFVFNLRYIMSIAFNIIHRNFFICCSSGSLQFNLLLLLGFGNPFWQRSCTLFDTWFLSELLLILALTFTHFSRSLIHSRWWDRRNVFWHHFQFFIALLTIFHYAQVLV